MATTLAVRLDDSLEAELDELCNRTGQTRSDLVRDALRRHLRLAEFRALREQMIPYAEAAGWLTDEDVFREVS